MPISDEEFDRILREEVGPRLDKHLEEMRYRAYEITNDPQVEESNKRIRELETAAKRGGCLSLLFNLLFLW